MKILIEELHDLPLVEAQVVVATGPGADPPGLEGLARHATELLRRGAGARDRAELDAAFDALGAPLDPLPGFDSAGFRLTCLARNLEPAVSLLGDVLARPRLDPDEHERLRRETLAALDDELDDDATLASRFHARLALPGHPYGRHPLGSRASLDRLTVDDVRAWIAAHVVRPNLIVGFAGDVEPGRAAALADATFAAVTDRPAAPPPAFPPLALAPGRRTTVVDKPERAQTQIVVGHAAPPPAHPDFIALHVAATAFGGSFSSRLMQEVRVKRGWSYGASFAAVRARGGHSFRLRVAPAAEQTADTLALVLGLWEQAVADGFSDAEIAHAQSYLEGAWAFDIETPGARLDQRVGVHTLGLRADAVETWLATMRALDAAAVNAAARRWWRPDAAVTVLVATAEELVPTLAAVPLGALTVVPYDAA
jgi:zinc protease